MGSGCPAVLLVLASATLAVANPASDKLRAEAAERIYSLDRVEALDLYRRAATADPNDAAAHRGIATTLWLNMTSERGNMTVDDYLGPVQKPTAAQPPPPEAMAAFGNALDRAVALARARISANPNDPDGHYQLGAAKGLKASFAATVERSAVAAFQNAREAFSEHERVLELDSQRRDAGLIVGTYRYVVASLALPLRWVAYIAGFRGDKDLAFRFVQEAVDYAGENESDARIALVLMNNRERRYDAALAQLAVLRRRYPRNRLFWLETGATSLRAGRAGDAERLLNEGMQRFASDPRPRMFGEHALWQYKRGTARAALGRVSDARQDLTAALGAEARPWVHGRSHLELGRLAAKTGDRQTARQHFRSAVTLCGRDNDAAGRDEARRLLAQVS